MNITTLIIVIGTGLGALELRTNHESLDLCHAAMDNFHLQFYRKQDRELTLPPVKVSCKEIKK